MSAPDANAGQRRHYGVTFAVLAPGRRLLRTAAIGRCPGAAARADVYISTALLGAGIGLASSLPATLSSGLQAHGVSAGAAHHAAQAPPISVLFAAFLGYNPVQHLVGAEALAALPHHAHATLTGAGFSRT
jgi:hypothetical protein